MKGAEEAEQDCRQGPRKSRGRASFTWGAPSAQGCISYPGSYFMLFSPHNSLRVGIFN